MVSGMRARSFACCRCSKTRFAGAFWPQPPDQLRKETVPPTNVSVTRQIAELVPMPTRSLKLNDVTDGTWRLLATPRVELVWTSVSLMLNLPVLLMVWRPPALLVPMPLGCPSDSGDLFTGNTLTNEFRVSLVIVRRRSLILLPGLSQPPRSRSTRLLPTQARHLRNSRCPPRLIVVHPRVSLPLWMNRPSLWKYACY
jgi:hypothetical protein